MPSYPSDITNQRFGRLVAQWPVGRRGKPAAHVKLIWLCLCDCGNLRWIDRSQLGSRTQSCGCLQWDMRAQTHTTHGMAGRGKARAQEYSLFSTAKYRAKKLG